MKKSVGAVIIISLFLFITACGAKEEKQAFMIQGKTMGTTYHITVVTSESPHALEQKIRQRLQEINRSMSTYLRDSEISRFNRMKYTDKKFPVSTDFLRVMTVAAELYGLTGGAWDGTVGPLVNLWGFGSARVGRHLPKAVEIRELLSQVGFGHIEVSQDGWLKKKNAALYLDLASIAKGYGVDQVASVIAQNGITDFLVEIGGEIYASGVRPDGDKWRIGINKPKAGSGVSEVYKVAMLHNKAFATSGDYRNFFEADGKRYSHVLDPRTGYAVSNGVVSVSVIAENCTFADGLATALMVMGHEKGLALVNRLDGTECLIIAEAEDGTLTDYYSAGFKVAED